MTRNTIDELGCYPNLDEGDTLLRYDTTLGDGASDDWKKKNPGAMSIKTPCTSLQEVKTEVNRLNNDHNNSMIDMDEVRRSHEQAQDRARINVEWRDMVQESDMRNERLQREVDRLKGQLEEKDKSMNEKKQKSYNVVERQRKNANRAKATLEKDEIEEYIDYGSEITFVQFEDLLAKAGGLSRLTLFNTEWHKKHGDAAKILWGYHDWNETKLYIEAYFPGEINVNYDPSMFMKVAKNNEIELPPLTPLEKCLICQMFFRSFRRGKVIALCFGRHQTRIGQILKEWAPKWANVGHDLACLDITSDYLYKEQPNRNIRLNKAWLVFVDGKDWLIAPKQNDTVVPKETYNSKTEEDSTRGLTYSTADGLIFEYLPLFGAHVGEIEVNRLMGSQGPVNAPVEEWKDIAISDPWKPEDDTFWIALSDTLSVEEFERMVEQIEEGGPLVSICPPDDGVLLTGQPTGLAKSGISAADADTDSDKSLGNNSCEEKSARDVFCISSALAEYETMVKMNAVEAVL